MMSVDEQIQMAKWASAHYRIVEIGCWLGGTTIILAENTKGQVWAVDDWSGAPDLFHRKPRAGLFQQFIANIQGWPNIRPVSKNSRDAAYFMRNLTFDMIFIDGDHSYEGVKTDIESWLPLLEKGGLMCGHDSTAKGVQKAVKEILGIDSGTTGLWSWYKP